MAEVGDAARDVGEAAAWEGASCSHSETLILGGGGFLVGNSKLKLELNRERKEKSSYQFLFVKHLNEEA